MDDTSIFKFSSTTLSYAGSIFYSRSAQSMDLRANCCCSIVFRDFGVFYIICKLKINNNQKGTEVTLEKVKFKLSSAIYPIFVPLLFVTCSNGNWHTGMIGSLFVQAVMYVITIKSSDPLYNFVLLIVAKLQVYEIVDSDQLYYCFIRSDSDKVKRNCLKLTRNWLIISK